MALRKQHVIDPEICIRCNTCEETCPIGAVTHDDNNYVVDPEKCNFCMDCIHPCPTGAIDNWRMVERYYTLEEQFSWLELPLETVPAADPAVTGEAGDAEAERLIAEAHAATGGRPVAPRGAPSPVVGLHDRTAPAVARVVGNYRVTAADSDSDVRHIVLDFGATPFPVVEGQSLGVIPPGTGPDGRPWPIRLYSISSPRDGEKPGSPRLVALTVKRVVTRRPDGSLHRGLCSNWLCDLERGAEVPVVGPFGTTFLLTDDPAADIVMICTGTGSAPFRAFTERRRRTMRHAPGRLYLFFGARTPEELPYFGPLQKVPRDLLHRELVYSRRPDRPREYVQDRMRLRGGLLAGLLRRPATHVYVCGVRGMEAGVEAAFAEIARSHGLGPWEALRARMVAEGRYHVETW